MSYGKFGIRQMPCERQASASANFDALEEETEKASTREELVELGRKRAALALYIGVSYMSTSQCWNCEGPISSDIKPSVQIVDSTTVALVVPDFPNPRSNSTQFFMDACSD